MSKGLEIVPCNLAEAKAFIKQHHRHHGAPIGGKFAIACSNGSAIVGVVVVGRPVARNFDDGWTAEITRLCTNGAKNACSMLYGAAWRAARAMGYRRLGTYILESESGSSLKAVGWKCLHKTQGGSWNCKARPRVDKHPTQRKWYWAIEADAQA